MMISAFTGPKFLVTPIPFTMSTVEQVLSCLPSSFPAWYGQGLLQKAIHQCHFDPHKLNRSNYFTWLNDFIFENEMILFPH